MAAIRLIEKDGFWIACDEDERRGEGYVINDIQVEAIRKYLSKEIKTEDDIRKIATFNAVFGEKSSAAEALGIIIAEWLDYKTLLSKFGTSNMQDLITSVVKGLS